MGDKVKVRLRGTAFHHGVRLRPGKEIDLDVEDLLEGRLPSWAEVIPGVTDMTVLAKHINAGDARGLAMEAKRRADKERKAAEEAKAKADKEEAQAKAAEKLAEEAEKRTKSK